MTNFAFIDGQNLHITVKEQLNWEIDYKKLYNYLKAKYKVEKAFYFIGYQKINTPLYHHLQKAGFSVIFKESTVLPDGKSKGNCDAELVLFAMIHFNRYDKAILIAGDGDYATLVKYLRRKNKLLKILVPNKQSYSFLLKKAAGKSWFEIISPINDLKTKLEFTKNRNTP